MIRPDADVVMTGMGLATCLGLSAAESWQAVLERRRGMVPLTALECVDKGAAPGSVPWHGGQARELPAGYMPTVPRESRYLRLAMDEALADAGININGAAWPYEPARCGVALGTSLHGIRQGGAYFRTGDAGRFGVFLAPAVLRAAAAGLATRGPTVTTCAACSSGLGSIGLAVTMLRSGVVDLVIAGGYDPVSEYAYAGFASLRLIAPGDVRPFCKGREGMKIAEGYAVLVLERAEDAAGRGAAARAWVRGIGESSDSHHLTQPHPEGHGALAAIRAAMEDAGIGPGDVGLIAAHATGTPNNDAAEFAAISSAMGDRVGKVPVVAFKSHLGHTLGAAGAAELVLSACALREQTVPPTANVRAEDLEFPLLAINTGPPRPAAIGATVNLSLGFGGANTCVVLSTGSAARTDSSAERAARDVLITGIGVLLPGAVGNERFAEVIGSPAGSDAAGAIPEEQYAHLVNARRVRRLSEYSKLTLGATALALSDAKVADIPAFTASANAILGTTHGSSGYSEMYYREVVEGGMSAANPMLFAEGVPNAAAAQLSMMFEVKGFCQTIVGSRTAGLDALWLASMRIASGEWERAIVSAGEEHSSLVDSIYAHFGLLAAEGTGRDAPGFGGFTTGAGAVAFVLESRASAALRGVEARGRVVSGRSLTAPDFSRADGVRTAAACLEAIGAPAHVLASLNGTWLDRVELAAIGAAQRGKGREATIVATCQGRIAECFSVGPLASIAAVLLRPGPTGRGRLPASIRDIAPRGGRLAGARGEPEVASFGVLCTDYAGGVAAARIGCGPG